MGFYIDLAPQGLNMQRFEEGKVPSAFWVLYAIAGFALLCMGLAAHSVLGDLLKMGSTFDLAIISLIFSAVPFYLLIGFKLFFIKKFVDFPADTLEMGYLIAGKKVLARKYARTSIQEITLVNKKPSPNVARRQHEDSQYHLQGHWRVLASVGKKKIVVDKHTDPGALEPLYHQLLQWKELTA